MVMFVLPFCGKTTTPVSMDSTNMEPENHPAGKKHHLRNLHYWVPCWFSGVYVLCECVCVYLYIYCIYTHIFNREERGYGVVFPSGGDWG